MYIQPSEAYLLDRQLTRVDTAEILISLYEQCKFHSIYVQLRILLYLLASLHFLNTFLPNTRWKLIRHVEQRESWDEITKEIRMYSSTHAYRLTETPLEVHDLTQKSTYISMLFLCIITPKYNQCYTFSKKALT